MVPCVVLGDSIAVGTSAAMPACQTIARVGISSGAYAAAHVVGIHAGLAVISLGSNDGTADSTAALEAVRSRLHADRVVWIIPNAGARAHALSVAEAYRDRVVDVRDVPLAPDHVHPTRSGYSALARVAASLGGPEIKG